LATLLLTGGTGFIGEKIIEELDKSDVSKKMDIDTIRLFVRNVRKAKKIKTKNFAIDVFEGDLLDHASIVKATEGIDYVIHTAALYKTYGKKKPFYDINVVGTRILINSLEDCKGFILTSTFGVYGFNANDGKPVKEDFKEKDPFWHYQESKKDQEELAQQLCAEKGINFIALRLPNVIGAGDTVGAYGVLNNLEKGLIFLLRKGEGKLPISHVADVARVHVKALAKIDQFQSEIFNVASFHVPFKKYINAYAKELDMKPIKKRAPYWLMYSFAAFLELLPIMRDFNRFGVKFLGASNVLDTTKVEKEFNFEPQHSFEETIKETVEWYQLYKETKD
jgi:nucleoside-diphosphate-sugar epimerase